MEHPSPQLVGCFALVFAAVVLVAACLRLRKGQPIERAGMIWAVLPSAVFFLLFWMLVPRIPDRPYGWMIEAELSPSAQLHGNVASIYMIVLVYFACLVVPVAMSAMIIRPRWNPMAIYPALAFAAFVPTFLSMLLAPEAFIRWWWD